MKSRRLVSEGNMTYAQAIIRRDQIKESMINNIPILDTNADAIKKFYTDGSLIPAEEIDKWARFIGLLNEYMS